MDIVFENVTKKIGRNIVVDNASFTIKSNSITGLKGINGSGKTMIMRLISGLIYPTSGKVFIGNKKLGEDISFPDSIGIMLENPAFLNGYNGYDNLRILADIKSIINEDDICEVMKLVGLEESGLKKYRKFSLGMKQRLGIAAAIMEKPEILILDEPTNSLDEDGVEMVKKILRQEKERGATIVLSCHDTQILEDLSDEIIEIQTGKIKGIYAPKEKIMWGKYVQSNKEKKSKGAVDSHITSCSYFGLMVC